MVCSSREAEKKSAQFMGIVTWARAGRKSEFQGSLWADLCNICCLAEDSI